SMPSLSTTRWRHVDQIPGSGERDRSMQTERGVGTDDEVPRFGTLRQGGWKAERCLPGATHTSRRNPKSAPGLSQCRGRAECRVPHRAGFDAPLQAQRGAANPARTGGTRYWSARGVALAVCCALAASGCGKNVEPSSELEARDGRAPEPEPEADGSCDPHDAASCPAGLLCRAATRGSGNVCAPPSSPDAGAPDAVDGGADDECLGPGCGSPPPLVTPPAPG